jgi:hypothetical protein
MTAAAPPPDLSTRTPNNFRRKYFVCASTNRAVRALDHQGWRPDGGQVACPNLLRVPGEECMPNTPVPSTARFQTRLQRSFFRCSAFHPTAVLRTFMIQTFGLDCTTPRHHVQPSSSVVAGAPFALATTYLTFSVELASTQCSAPSPPSASAALPFLLPPANNSSSPSRSTRPTSCDLQWPALSSAN